MSHPPNLQESPEAPTPSPPTKPAHSWARTVTWIGVTAILAATLITVWIYHGLRTLPGEVARGSQQILEGLGEVAAAFQSGTVTTRFISHATSVSDNSFFQFATLEQTEVFQRTDEATVLWGHLDLPDLIVEATAPVTYTYYLDLDGRWEMRLEGETVHVLAPPIQYNRPAVDASQIEYSVRAGSLIRDEADGIARLKAGITSMAEERAVDNISLVRELGRRKTEEFVQNWLARGFGDGSDYRARVLFADEIEGLSPTVDLPAKD